MREAKGDDDQVENGNNSPYFDSGTVVIFDVAEQQVDQRYYEAARPGSLAARLVRLARANIFGDFLRLTGANPESTVLDLGVSDVVGDAPNHLERMYPYPERITAAGLGEGVAFRAAFPRIGYVRIVAGAPLPFADRAFDIAASNAVLEHLGSEAAQRAFLAELVRVATKVFVSVPNRYFPFEHHTAIPLLHWSDFSFRIASFLTGSRKWARPENLIPMTGKRLHALCVGEVAEIGYTGLRLGRFSSNLYLLIDRSTSPGNLAATASRPQN
jgi:hypothetical protein